MKWGDVGLLVSEDRFFGEITSEIAATLWAFDEREVRSWLRGESVNDNIFNPSGIATRTAVIFEPLAGALPRAVGALGRIARGWDLVHRGSP